MNIISVGTVGTLLIALAFPTQAQQPATEAKARELQFRAIRFERTKDDLEVFVYSIKNTSKASITVLMTSEGTRLGLCNEFGKSSVPMIPPSEMFNLKGRGLTLGPGEETEQTLIASKNCLRETHVTNFDSDIFIRYPDRLVTSVNIGLGPFRLKPPGIWP
jgi:hypothetical protein